MDEEILAEMAEFLDDTLLREFASDQGLVYEARFEQVADGYRCILLLGEFEMPSVTAKDEQTALDRASIQAIELLTRNEQENEPMLVFA
ncbi:MAG TPA: hypothetical protein VGE65_02950 [Sphingobium sp.]